jgi:hypothetical protein
VAKPDPMSPSCSPTSASACPRAPNLSKM